MTLVEVKAILAGMLAGMEQNSAEEQSEALRIAIRFMGMYQDCARCRDCAMAVETRDNELQCTSGAYDIHRKSCFVLKTE